MPPPCDRDEPAVRREHAARPAQRKATDQLAMTLNADWLTASLARDRVRDWLSSHHWPESQVEDLVLVVSEAVSNSAEHGYRLTRDAVGHLGVIELRGRIQHDRDGHRTVEFLVTDRGCWLEPTDQPSSRRHGLPLMRALTSDLSIEGTPDGTTIHFSRHETPPDR